MSGSEIFYVSIGLLSIALVFWLNRDLYRSSHGSAFEAVCYLIALPALIIGWYFNFQYMRGYGDQVGYETLVLLLVTSGLAHLPPIKVVTILSGAANINLGLFIISAIIARGARFFVLAWLLRRYGEEIRHFIEKRLGMLAAAVAGLLIAMFAAYRFLA